MNVFIHHVDFNNRFGFPNHDNFTCLLIHLWHVDLTCWLVLLYHVDFTCQLILLYHVDLSFGVMSISLVDLFFDVMSTSLVDLFFCVMSTLLVNVMTFIISTPFVGFSYAMPNHVILAWFLRWSPSLVIFPDQLPLGKSSWGKNIPNGASLFSPSSYNLVDCNLLRSNNSNDLPSKFCMDCTSLPTSWKTFFFHSHLVCHHLVGLNSFPWISSSCI
jgi:hypothetical protein